MAILAEYTLGDHLLAPAPLLALIGENLTLTEGLVVGFALLFVVALAFLGGQFWQRLRSRRQLKTRETQMFQIEKALQEFFEHDKNRLGQQIATLEQDNQRLREQVEDYRRRAAGVTGKRSKDTQADLLLGMLLENEQLQERLYEQHAREKDDRDRQLKKELANISYQRVLLSRLLEDRGVKEAVVEVLADETVVRELQAGVDKAGPEGGARGSGD